MGPPPPPPPPPALPPTTTTTITTAPPTTVPEITTPEATTSVPAEPPTKAPVPEILTPIDPVVVFEHQAHKVHLPNPFVNASKRLVVHLNKDYKDYGTYRPPTMLENICNYNQ